MKAWRVYGIGDMRLDDVPMPKVKPGWVLVKVKTVQLSVTEISHFRGYSGNLNELLEKESPRQMFGHEFCGEAVEVGEGVSSIKVGDRVVCCGREPCHQCALCLAGYENLCTKGPMLGTDIPGALAEYFVLPAGYLTSIPDTMTDSEGAAMQPFTGSMGAVHLTGIEMGDTVVVLGQGSMGLNVAQICRVCSAGRVIGVDIRDDVLDISKKLGIDIVINANKVDTVEAVFEATKGVGADVVFECAGGSPKQGLTGTESLARAMRMVRDQGRISQVALLGKNAMVDVSPLNMSGVQYRGLGRESRKLVQYAIDLVTSKRVRLDILITHVLEGLDKIPEAIEITGNKAKYQTINPAQVIISK
jgi:threonine dehydrogenase-like Zn-dependent dehydrogenase